MLMSPHKLMAAGTPRTKPVPPDSPVQPGQMIAEKYRVDQVIAVGGMGIVVAAVHVQLGQEVAIKVLLPTELAQEPHAAARFVREARAAACMRSDHVVRIHDVGSLPDGLPYMVMERLYGSDLRALLRARGPLPIADVVEYVTQACDGIGEAHRMGIVHRDLKPSNLFLTTKHGGRELVKVLDFGISKAAQQAPLEATLTTSRTLIGSPLYMSPEQIRDPKSVDARSDIWSLGIILHQLLTGKPAFTADSLPAVCAAIAADPPASTRERRPEVPEQLERVIMRCLEKLPPARYASVEELCAALAPFGRESVLSSRSGPIVLTGEESDNAVTIGYRPITGEKAVLAQSTGHHLRSDAPLANTQHAAEPPRRRKLWAPLLIASTVLVALAAAALWSRSNQPRTPEQAADQTRRARPATFELRMESAPSGATVFDGQRRLGETPLVIALENQELERAPKRFTLRLDGHEPYNVVQGSSDMNLTVRAQLEAVTEPAPSASADSPAPPSRASRSSGTKPRSTPATTGRTDIRLER
jgi:serine/threonine protein kinase